MLFVCTLHINVSSNLYVCMYVCCICVLHDVYVCTCILYTRMHYCMYVCTYSIYFYILCVCTVHMHTQYAEIHIYVLWHVCSVHTSSSHRNCRVCLCRRTCCAVANVQMALGGVPAEVLRRAEGESDIVHIHVIHDNPIIFKLVQNVHFCLK